MNNEDVSEQPRVTTTNIPFSAYQQPQNMVPRVSENEEFNQTYVGSVLDDGGGMGDEDGSGQNNDDLFENFITPQE